MDLDIIFELFIIMFHGGPVMPITNETDKENSV